MPIEGANGAPVLERKFWADAGDDGFRFILSDVWSVHAGGTDDTTARKGGILRSGDGGHLATIVGRGGTGKSILALQLVNELLMTSAAQRPAAFYFTLEASPKELDHQSNRFGWNMARHAKRPQAAQAPHPEVLRVKEPSVARGGLAIVPIPSPTEDFASFVLHIKQTVARHLDQFDELSAIVVDPLGGITLAADLRSELNQLKQLSDSHETFVLLLTEDYVFNAHRSIEHYSQTIIHLEHDPKIQPSRRLHIQKARNQPFRSGYHQFEIHQEKGIRVFPSVQAQSAFAHEELERSPRPPSSNPIPLLSGGKFSLDGSPGSVVFLMGPPGTFKQYIAVQFCTQQMSGSPGDSAIYISFKADESDVRRQVVKNPHVTGVGVDAIEVRPLEELLRPIREQNDADASKLLNESRRIWFRNARSPLLTPEEILGEVRTIITKLGDTSRIRRAVVWGLRRLADMPNFEGGTAVQFLEALVTLLKTRAITSLLVDWPDFDRTTTLPIVDLSQYILFTRVCRGKDDLAGEAYAHDVWPPELDERRRHVALVRVQRDAEGYHRNKGAYCFKSDAEKTVLREIGEGKSFEALWMTAGVRWEKDPDLGDYSRIGKREGATIPAGQAAETPTIRKATPGEPGQAEEDVEEKK
jgi:KaiC/GvpD/RAD55 family RecA-like ATPase